MDRTIEARIAALEAELAELKKAVAVEVAPPISDRRGMIKLVAATAVGAVTGAAILGAEPAAAVDDLPIVQGRQNDGSFATGVHATQSHGLIVQGDNGVGVISHGVVGNAWFPSSDQQGPPKTSLGPGVLSVDSEGNWFGSIVAATPQTFVSRRSWRKLAGPSTAGQLHVLPRPLRVYDTRSEEGAKFGFPGPTTANQPRTIETAIGLPPDGVPLGVNAVMITLTITRPQTPGFAAAWPTGPWPGTSTINFAAGQDIATTTVVGCAPGPDSLIQVMANTVTDFLIDMIGYYQ